jgi:DNA-binding GntR family transcriptional regulator
MASWAEENGTISTGAGSLGAIAESVRGSFQTVEDMTQSFIREAILQGIFKPGERLNLDRIAEVLGVSRMPVRASLRQLEGEGLLTIHPYRGARVSSLSAEQIAEIYELRIVLESYLLDKAAEKMDAGAFDTLQESLENLKKSDDTGSSVEARQAFYTTLYQYASRPRALALVVQLQTAVGRYLRLQRVEESPVHENLLDYLRSGEVEPAKRWLAEHLRRVSGTLERLVEQSESKTE